MDFRAIDDTPSEPTILSATLNSSKSSDDESWEEPHLYFGPPCEYIGNYCPGGLQPVHIGDTFKDGQYKIIRKLGHGSSSTVWLARDLRNNIYVALKFLKSGVEQPIREVQLLQHLTQADPEAASRHLTQLLDNFQHEGPNGTHTCLVFEAMGPDVNHMLELLPQFYPRRFEMKIRWPFWMAKSILKQSLQALAFLHGSGIALGDFHQGNMLFQLDDISSVSEEEVKQPMSPVIHAIEPVPPEKQHKGTPRYQVLEHQLEPFTSYSDDFKIKLSDLGGAYFFTDPPKDACASYCLRSPEEILTGKVGSSLDVWVFGCLVFELITGNVLFPIWSMSDHKNDQHLLMMSARLGPLPDELFKHWETASWYYTSDKKLYNCKLGGLSEGEEPTLVDDPSLERYFDEAETGLSEEEATTAKSLLRRILCYDPKERPSFRELLDDPFFS